MLLWIIAIVVLALWILAGYYQGAIRAGFTLLGLLLGAMLSLPLAGVAQSLLAAFGVKHPVLLTFLGPTAILLLLFMIFKGAGFFAHNKIYRYYKYRTDDQQRVLWERLNQQMGICLGVANGVVAVILLCIGIYVPGYFTVQVASEDKDPWWLGMINTISKDMDETGFYKAVSPFVPVSEFYYEASDVLGTLFRNPRLQNRLSRYPMLMPMAEEERFQEIGKDSDFQDFWKKQPSLQEFMAQGQINPLVRDGRFYTQMVDLLGEDLPDLQTYLMTGSSPKFADQRLVDRWHFNYGASYQKARQIKSNMTVAEHKWLRAVYQTVWVGASFTAFLDNTVIIKKKSRSGKGKNVQGKWKHSYGPKYMVTLREDGRLNEFETLVATNEVTLSMGKVTLVFEK